jgi:hypothetical protein
MSMVRARLLPSRTQLLKEARTQDPLRVLPSGVLPRRAAVQEGSPAIPDGPGEADRAGGEDGRTDRGGAARAEGERREGGGEGEGEVRRRGGWREGKGERREVVWREGKRAGWAEKAEGERSLLRSYDGDWRGDGKILWETSRLDSDLELGDTQALFLGP